MYPVLCRRESSSLSTTNPKLIGSVNINDCSKEIISNLKREWMRKNTYRLL